MSRQPCELLCRTDCVVTTFSGWSACDPSCRLPNRTRVREIVLPPRHGGGHCPSFSEMRSCDNCTESYTYLLGRWEACQPFDSTFMRNVKTHPLIGYQSRVITCLGRKGTVTSFRHCTEKIKEPLLPQHQACIIPQDCIVSGWSPLSPYNNSCVGEAGIVPGYMVRSRTVIQVPLGDGKPCPSQLQEMVKLQGENPYELKACRSSKWILSGWSNCESVPGYSHCGKGIQSRKAICVELDDDGVERPVLDESLCPQPKPLISQGCEMECNWDCSVSQWSLWSDCFSNDCRSSSRKRQSVQLIGKRHRMREVLTLPGPGGRECPHLSETQLCQPRPCFSWNLTIGECQPTQPGGCGIGHRAITAVCVNRAGDAVIDRRCWDQRGSQPWQDCYVPCAEDCVTSEWSAWSSCPEPCSPHSAGPNIQTRERTILAYPGKGGQPCPPVLNENHSCPSTVECAKYFWKTEPWGPCVLEDGSIQCGRGLQTRKITCYNEQGQPVLARRCEERVKPAETQSCTLDCPVDCLVTEWSNWSTCLVSCLDVPSQILPKQRRQRFILQYPSRRGSPCPNSLFEERSCLNLPVCDSFFWHISPWSQCILPPIVPYCGDGLRARNITCKHANGTVHPLNTCLLNTGAMPKIVDMCHVSCERECQITDWSRWGPCVGGCSGNRFRTRKLLGKSRFIAECKDIKKYPLDEQEQCFCSQLQPIVIGGWSDCILEERLNKKQRFAQMSLKSLTHRSTNETAYSDVPVQAYCGVGTRYKAVACRNGRRDMERASKCSHDEYEEEVCVVPCPVDCELSEWSEWSQCSVTCGSGMQVRVRSILTQPADGGRKCPSFDGSLKETQSRVCHMNCQYHMWEDGEWGACNPITGMGCGRGTQSRRVRCKAVSEMSQSSYIVDEHFCRELPRPMEERTCVLPCPGDCVLSEWEAWSQCNQPCNGQQFQKRKRKILRKGTTYYRTSNSDCTLPLHEQRACVRGTNCIEYSWQLSDWTSCLVNGGFEQCGVGHKERFAWCRDQQGTPMDNFHCEKIFGRVTEPLVVSCEIPCDVDCLLSSWSDWSPCSRSCGLGTTKRFRTVVQNGEGNGRQCPTNMQQSKPCFKSGCYKWEVTEWSHCQSRKSVCGSGVQRRNVSCVGEDALPVDTIRCPLDLEKLVMKTEQSCRIACPGECRLSGWSQWSDCHVSCQDYNNGLRQGIRARSRAVLAYPGPGKPPCSEALWEELPCLALRCYNFFWTTTKWRGLHRSVWCQRSDGLNVTGGCDPRERPATRLQCVPSCALIDGSVCVDTNLCKCFEKYESVYSNGSLIACVMDSNDTTTAVSTSVTLSSDSSSNVLMYAILGVVTVLLIIISAALYNMCELFRTGPRPRSRVGTAKSSQNDLRGSQSLHNEKVTKLDGNMESLYKNCTSSHNDAPNNDTAAAAAAAAVTPSSERDKEIHSDGGHVESVREKHGLMTPSSSTKSCPDVSHSLYNCLLCSPLTNACSERRRAQPRGDNTRTVCAQRTPETFRPGWNAAVYSNVEDLGDLDLERQSSHDVRKFKSNDNRHSSSSLLLRPVTTTTSNNCSSRGGSGGDEENEYKRISKDDGGFHESVTGSDGTAAELYSVPHKNKLKPRLDDLRNSDPLAESFESTDSGTSAGSPVTVRSFNGVVYRDYVNQNVTPPTYSESLKASSPVKVAVETEEEEEEEEEDGPEHTHPFVVGGGKGSDEVELPLMSHSEAPLPGDESGPPAERCKYCESSNPKLKKLCSGHRTFWPSHLKNDKTFPVTVHHEQGRWLLSGEPAETGDQSPSNKRETTV